MIYEILLSGNFVPIYSDFEIVNILINIKTVFWILQIIMWVASQFSSHYIELFNVKLLFQLNFVLNGIWIINVKARSMLLGSTPRHTFEIKEYLLMAWLYLFYWLLKMLAKRYFCKRIWVLYHLVLNKFRRSPFNFLHFFTFLN